MNFIIQLLYILFIYSFSIGLTLWAERYKCQHSSKPYRNRQALMDILLTQKYKYTINNSIEDVRNDFSKITNARGYNFANNITGTLNVDNTFSLTHKWTFGYIRGIGNSFVYLKGTITSEGTRTIINTTLSQILAWHFSYTLWQCFSFVNFLVLKQCSTGRVYQWY